MTLSIAKIILAVKGIILDVIPLWVSNSDFTLHAIFIHIYIYQRRLK